MKNIKQLKVNYDTPLEKQLAELGIMNYLDLEYLTHIAPRPADDTIYDVEDGTEMTGKSVNDACKEFATQGRRGLTVHEALALYRENPDVLKHHNIDCAGSRYGSDLVPSLWLIDVRPKLGSYDADGADPGWGSASCGSRGLEVGILDVSDFESLVFDGLINGTRYAGELKRVEK